MVFTKQIDTSFNRFGVMILTSNSEVSSISNEHEPAPKKKYYYLVEKGQIKSMYHYVHGGEHPLCKFAQTKGTTGKIHQKIRRCNHKDCKNRLYFSEWLVNQNVMDQIAAI